MLKASACAHAPDVHPHFIDYGLNECQEHAVLDKENFTISDSVLKVWPLEHCDGYITISMKEFKLMKDYILKEKKKCKEAKACQALLP